MNELLSQFKREAEIWGVRKHNLREPKMVEVAVFERFAQLIALQCIVYMQDGDTEYARYMIEKHIIGVEHSKTGVGKTSEGSENV
jgi:hypothetical protein